GSDRPGVAAQGHGTIDARHLPARVYLRTSAPAGHGARRSPASGVGAHGYTKVLGLHPLLATRCDTGEVLHARMRKGSANTQRGAKRFIEELVARLRRAGASGKIIMRFDSGYWSNETITVL